ncbi:MAG: ABC transporter permease, partial [Lentisphaerota bacterium]
MKYEWFVSLRYLKAKHRHGFISIISLISVAGVAVGVTALIVVLAVMTGFTGELRDKILGINSHVVIQKIDGPIRDHAVLIQEVLQVPGVVAATPYIYSQVMISSSGEDGTGTVLRGIEPSTAGLVLSLSKQIIAGSLADLEPDNKNAVPEERQGARASSRLPGIILGSELAKYLRVTVGDRVRMFSPAGPLTPMGIIPKIRTCRVAAIFESGMYEYDSSLAYISLATAQEFLELGDAVHGLELSVSDIYEAGRIGDAVKEKLGLGFIAKDWIRMILNLFSALKLEKTAMFIVLALIVLVAAFNIISTLIMVVMEKGKDIAILKSMGATSGSIM